MCAEATAVAHFAIKFFLKRSSALVQSYIKFHKDYGVIKRSQGPPAQQGARRIISNNF